MSDRIRILPSVVFVFLIATASAVAFAGNPNPQTPNDESICDDVKYGTPGLYGLCIAFWAGQDCVPDFEAEDPFEDCKPGSLKILEKYRAKMQPGEPDMPGLRTPCPCFDDQDIQAVLDVDPDGLFNACGSNPGYPGSMRLATWNQSNGGDVGGDFAINPPLGWCAFVARLEYPGPIIDIYLQEISDEEMASCSETIFSYLDRCGWIWD